ncbi:MAG: cadherin repeat domain-containing protein, partial [Rhodobiaceae bacterium]|nr:cadherin repeat domain-containing protein [Rhodobiaceae bacterium]
MADETNREDETEVRNGNESGGPNDDLFVFDEGRTTGKRREETEADLTGLDSARAADDVTNPNIHMGIERGEVDLPEGATLGGAVEADTDPKSTASNDQVAGDRSDTSSGRDPLVAADVDPTLQADDGLDKSMGLSPASESLLDEPEMDRDTMEMKLSNMDGADISAGAVAQGNAGAGSSFVEPDLPPEAFNRAPDELELSNKSFDENAPGAVVGTLSTNDAGEHTYEVSDARFEVVDGVLKLRPGLSLNHEAEPSVALSVTVTDEGGLSFTQEFTLAVGDVNEGPESVDWTPLPFDENVEGASVGIVHVTDPDNGETFTYTVSDPRFEVVEQNGRTELRLKDGESLDAEQGGVPVTVTVTDSGGETATTSVTVTPGDVNEGPSDIALSNASVDENAAGAVVGTLSTTDVDAGDSHTYAVDDARFEVVGGELKLKDGVSLDHEAESSVAVEVTTTDASGATYSETFTIAVGDVNEGPSDIALSNASVDENAAGAVVGTLSTTDVDAGDSHTYAVDDARFEVVGGELKLKDGVSLDHEAESSVAVEVTTTDASGATYSETFTIAVGDV